MVKAPQKVLLSKLGTLKKGGAILREKLRPEGVAVILYGDIYTKYAEIVTRLVSRVDPSAVVDGVRLNSGDIVFAGSGETAEEIGKCIAYVGREEAYAGGDVVILTNHGQDAHYLGYALNAEDAIRQKIRLGQGSSVMHLYKDDVGSIKIPLPSFAEQRKIAEILRTWDEAIEIAEVELKAKQERKRSLMKKLLMPSVEGAEEVMAKSLQKVSLSKLGDLKKGGAILRDKLRPDGVAVVLYGDIYTKYAEIVSVLSSRVDPAAVVDGVRLNNGDIVFAGSGETAEEIGKCVAYVGTEEAYAGGDLVILTDHGQDARYLGYALNAEDAIRQKMRLGQGSSVMHLYKDDVGSIKICLPPLAEQRKLAEILQTGDEEIELIKKQTEVFRAQKRGLMQKLLTGEVRVAA